jgi:hypothetical protein
LSSSSGPAALRPNDGTPHPQPGWDAGVDLSRYRPRAAAAAAAIDTP